eukprot:TRINITY_DN4963_c0_g1_i13.p1 TRINITY_DN4963_c0_g1~~TRINITY_DN4963_c0_g1_i13.p1  ORF type:complete len:194 (+),score=40.31 TRINITY_DN4963_c0_g1_i13:501-1082(+)
MVNYESFTKQAYATGLSFPLTWYFPRQQKQTTLDYLSFDGFNDEDKVKQVANEIYTTLSNRLGEREFFFGDQPSRLDCFVFGFLRTQALKDIPKSHLQDLLLSHQNLVDFCNRILANWYPQESGMNLNYKLDYKPLHVSFDFNFFLSPILQDFVQNKKKKISGMTSEGYTHFLIFAGFVTLVVFGGLVREKFL